MLRSFEGGALQTTGKAVERPQDGKSDHGWKLVSEGRRLGAWLK
jgi:hypothetical protein